MNGCLTARGASSDWQFMQLGRASTRGYRLGVVLALIALTPLVGATFFAVHEVMSARAEREAATAVGMTIEELVVVSELRAALTDEHNWTAVVEGVTELGLPIELVNGLTGVDISARLDMARADVDARTGSLGYDDVALSIAAVRDDPDIDLGKELQAILDIERTLATRADGELNRALGQAAGIGDGGTLVNRLRVLEQATLARQAASGSFSEYFGARFATQNGVEQVMALNMDEGRRTWALERLEVLADEDTEAAAAIEVIKNSAAVAQVESDVLRLLTSSVDGTRQSGSLNNVMLELDTIGGTVEAHTVSSDRYSELVAAAGIDASRSVAAAQNAASGRNTQAVAALLAVLVLSALTAVAATRAIARPVRNLARAARKIRDGDTEIGPFPETGPIEIRIAARAINEAAGHLALAEAQALALRDGILDHEALSEQAPGAIGASLQTAVQTLAASMQERERMRAQMR